MAKYSEKIAQQIFDLIAKGEHTDRDVCLQVGITPQTFIEWKNTKADFAELIEEAYVERQAAFAKMARSGLAKLIDVYEYEEVTTEALTDSRGRTRIIRNAKTVTKKIMPNVNAVIFALTNAEPERFKNLQSLKVDHTTKGDKINQGIDLSKLSFDELTTLEKLIQSSHSDNAGAGAG